MTAVPLTRKSQLFLIGLLTAIFFINFLARVALAPLLPVIEKDLGLGHAGAGSFFMMIAIGYAAGLFVSGYLSSWLTFRQTIALAAVAIGCAFFFVAASRTLWAIHIGLVLTGIPAGIYLSSAITTITASVSPANWGKAISIHELAPSLSFMAAPLIVEGLLVFFPWQGVLALIGGVSVILGLSFLRLGQGGDFKGEAPTLGNIRLSARQAGLLDHGRPVQPGHRFQYGPVQHDDPLPCCRTGDRPGSGKHAGQSLPAPRPRHGPPRRLGLGPFRNETDTGRQPCCSAA